MIYQNDVGTIAIFYDYGVSIINRFDIVYGDYVAGSAYIKYPTFMHHYDTV